MSSNGIPSGWSMLWIMPWLVFVLVVFIVTWPVGALHNWARSQFNT